MSCAPTLQFFTIFNFSSMQGLGLADQIAHSNETNKHAKLSRKSANRKRHQLLHLQNVILVEITIDSIYRKVVNANNAGNQCMMGRA
jgi:hypothetical protein